MSRKCKKKMGSKTKYCQKMTLTVNFYSSYKTRFNKFWIGSTNSKNFSDRQINFSQKSAGNVTSFSRFLAHFWWRVWWSRGPWDSPDSSVPYKINLKIENPVKENPSNDRWYSIYKKIVTKNDFTNVNPKTAPPVAAPPMIAPPTTAPLPVQPHTVVHGGVTFGPVESERLI